MKFTEKILTTDTFLEGNHRTELDIHRPKFTCQIPKNSSSKLFRTMTYNL